VDRSDALAPFLADPRDAAVLVDFDGTLAAIVDDPATARPLPGVVEALRALAARYALVGVVSGRPLAFLEAHLPEEVALSGLYGIEWRRDGDRGEHPAAAGWRPVVADVVARARAELPGEVEVEAKGTSLTLHVRRHPELTGAAHAWADGAAGAVGLHVRPAKRSVELHPPVAVDKGTVVEGLVGPLGTACFIGDDVGDLPAFDALDRLAARGCRTLRVVVQSPEITPQVLARADVVVPGPDGTLALLRELLGGGKQP
jgi:trehalose 6-phosphate phosphatase